MKKEEDTREKNGKHSKSKDNKISKKENIKTNKTNKKEKEKISKINKKEDLKINKKNKKTHKKKTWKKILLTILLILVILIGWFAFKTVQNGGGLKGMLSTVVGQNEEKRKDLKEIKVLLLGVSTDLESELTDTIIVASYNPNTQKANLLSIPRDTYTGTNTKKASASLKINALYNIDKTPEKTLKAVNDLTGLDIQYFAVIKTEGLRKLVDAIGGVKYNVPENMDYDDKTQDLHIHLQKGEQVLNGDKAEQLLRFRHSNTKNGVMTTYSSDYGNDDLGRMRTQRDFIIATLKQTLKPSNIFRIGQILEIADENIDTNIELNFIKDYVPYAVELNTENIKSAMLPVTTPDVKDTNGVSIAVIDKLSAKALIQSMFYEEESQKQDENAVNSISNGNSSSTSLHNSSRNNTTSSITTNSQNSKDPSEIKIELINGSGSAEKFEKAKQQLEDAGYNIKMTDKTKKIASTVITNKTNIKDEDVKKIKDVLGKGNISIMLAQTGIDVSIVIGEDFE